MAMRLKNDWKAHSNNPNARRIADWMNKVSDLFNFATVPSGGTAQPTERGFQIEVDGVDGIDFPHFNQVTVDNSTNTYSVRTAYVYLSFTTDEGWRPHFGQVDYTSQGPITANSDVWLVDQVPQLLPRGDPPDFAALFSPGHGILLARITGTSGAWVVEQVAVGILDLTRANMSSEEGMTAGGNTGNADLLIDEWDATVHRLERWTAQAVRIEKKTIVTGVTWDPVAEDVNVTTADYHVITGGGGGGQPALPDDLRAHVLVRAG